MSFEIESIDFFVRETKPARFRSALGKKGQKGQKGERATSPLCHVRLRLKSDKGERTFGCSADRLSVRWLDKRPGRSKAKKLRELASLIEWTGELYSKSGRFETPFELWRKCHDLVMREGKKRGQVALSSTFASALLERAVIDGVCRMADAPLFVMLKKDQLGIRPRQIHAELGDLSLPKVLPALPVTEISVRHTVGLFDPLTPADLADEDRPRDGLPETVADYIQRDGLRYFKVKISGQVESDLQRLEQVWSVVSAAPQPVITLDANEAYDDLDRFQTFVRRLEKEQLGLFQHISLIEQPLPRRLTFDARTSDRIREIGKSKPLIIDEADGGVTAFRQAKKLGYAGASHKNCKGLFKSLLNLMLVAHYSLQGEEGLLSAEDLQNLPIVPLHQDFVSVGVLGLDHCERNGHHYNHGLSMLSDKDKESAIRHRDLYVKRGKEWFLRIRDGKMSCASLHGPGFGVRDEPDWPSMTPLRRWLNTRYPA